MSFLRCARIDYGFIPKRLKTIDTHDVVSWSCVVEPRRLIAEGHFPWGNIDRPFWNSDLTKEGFRQGELSTSYGPNVIVNERACITMLISSHVAWLLFVHPQCCIYDWDRGAVPNARFCCCRRLHFCGTSLRRACLCRNVCWAEVMVGRRPLQTYRIILSTPRCKEFVNALKADFICGMVWIVISKGEPINDNTVKELKACVTNNAWPPLTRSLMVNDAQVTPGLSVLVTSAHIADIALYNHVLYRTTHKWLCSKTKVFGIEMRLCSLLSMLDL